MVGQEPMVRTLTNAFETGRIAQAYMLTGVRGVGKTTTARILARALNYKTAGDRQADDRSAHSRRALPGDHGRPPCRCHRDGCRLPYRHRRHPRDHRAGALPPGFGPLQGLYHRRSAHALDAGLQRPAEDARRAAGACEIHFRDHRNPQGSDHGPVALPALRSAPHSAHRISSACSPPFSARKAFRPIRMRWR